MHRKYLASSAQSAQRLRLAALLFVSLPTGLTFANQATPRTTIRLPAQKRSPPILAWEGTLLERASGPGLKQTYESRFGLLASETQIVLEQNKTRTLIDLASKKSVTQFIPSKQVLVQWTNEIDLVFPYCGIKEWSAISGNCFSQYRMQATRMRDQIAGVTVTIWEGETTQKKQAIKIRAWVPETTIAGAPVLKWMTIHPNGQVREYTWTDYAQKSVDASRFAFLPNGFQWAIPAPTKKTKSTPKK